MACGNHRDNAVIAKRAGVKTLVLTHLLGQIDQPSVRELIVHEIQKVFEGNVIWGEDPRRLPLANARVSTASLERADDRCFRLRQRPQRPASARQGDARSSRSGSRPFFPPPSRHSRRRTFRDDGRSLCAGDRNDSRRARHAGCGGGAWRYGQRVGFDDHHRAGPETTSVEYITFSRDHLQPPLMLTYPLDGSVGRNTVMMGRGEQIVVVARSVEWTDADHHHDIPGCRSWRGKAVHRRIGAKAVVGIADDLGCGSDPRRRARRACVHDPLGLSEGLRTLQRRPSSSIGVGSPPPARQSPSTVPIASTTTSTAAVRPRRRRDEQRTRGREW